MREQDYKTLSHRFTRAGTDLPELPGEIEPMDSPPSFAAEAAKSIVCALVAMMLAVAISWLLSALLIEGRLW